REASGASAAWPFDSAGEEAYLAAEYGSELIDAAARSGISIRKLGSELIAFPTVLRVLARDRSILVDGKKQSLVRPSAVVAHLVEIRNRKPAMTSDRFLEVLYSAYRTLSGKDGGGQAVALSRIYEVLTLLPG